MIKFVIFGYRIILKKAGIIAIGLFMTVFVTAHFFIFKISQSEHKAMFRSFILKNLNQLEKVEISPSQLFSDSKNLKWLDNNKEIMLNGLVYDVVSIKNSGKTVSLFVVNDVKEKNLMDTYNQLASSIFDSGNPSKPNLLKDFLSLKFFQSNALEFTNYNSSVLNTYSGFIAKTVTIFLSQETPPPNNLF